MTKDETYNGYTNWDTWEFKLLLDNDEDAYHRVQAWAKNFARKQRKGRYDSAQAAKAVKLYLGPIVRRLERSYDASERINPKLVNYIEIADEIRDEGIEDMEYQEQSA